MAVFLLRNNWNQAIYSRLRGGLWTRARLVSSRETSKVTSYEVERDGARYVAKWSGSRGVLLWHSDIASWRNSIMHVNITFFGYVNVQFMPCNTIQTCGMYFKALA